MFCHLIIFRRYPELSDADYLNIYKETFSFTALQYQQQPRQMLYSLIQLIT